jgi:2-dehydro-3-deoxygluconokinase
MDVISFGEALIIFSPNKPGAIRFVDSFHKSVGGAEANVLIALARLGFKTGFISKLGDDGFGDYINSSLRSEGIDVSHVDIDSKSPTGMLFKELDHNPNPNVYYYRSNSAVTKIDVESINKECILSGKYFHITGITPALSTNCYDATFKMLKIAKSSGVKISFDPNLRMKLWNSVEHARETMLKIASYADIIFPGLDEAEFILGTSDIDEICAKFHELGAKIVVIKLGENGCLISDNNIKIKVSGYKPHRIVDTVGAGDGFAAGFIAGQLQNKSLAECGEFANAIGAMALMVESDSCGYPTMRKLLEFMGKAKAVER